MSEQRTYDKPMTFVNTKRVRVGDKTAKGADKLVLTFGLTKDFKTGAEINTLDQLIDALLPYQGKQVNLTVFTQEKESNGRKFPTAYVGITEMIPKDAQDGVQRTGFVAKKPSAATSAANVRAAFTAKG